MGEAEFKVVLPPETARKLEHLAKRKGLTMEYFLRIIAIDYAEDSFRAEEDELFSGEEES